MRFTAHCQFFPLILILLMIACTRKEKVREDVAPAIIELIKLRSQAVVKTDTATLDSILARDFRYINIFGESLSREEYLKNNASLGNDSSRWISQGIDSIDVRVLNSSAVVTFRVLDKFIYEGVPYENYCRSTFVYELQDDAWKCILGHTTKIE
jgi:hypothetical protein